MAVEISRTDIADLLKPTVSMLSWARLIADSGGTMRTSLKGLYIVLDSRTFGSPFVDRDRVAGVKTNSIVEVAGIT
jgi:hypothetical protein